MSTNLDSSQFAALRVTIGVAATAALLSAAATAAFATSFTSIQDGSWGSTSTWSPGGIPGCGDSVVIAGGTTVTLDTTRCSADMTVSGTLDIHNNFYHFQGNTFTNSGTVSSVTGSYGEIDFQGVAGAGSTTQTIAGTGVYAPGGSQPVEIHIQNNTTVTPAAGTVISGVRKFITDSGTILLANTFTFGDGTISGTITASGSGKLLTQGTTTVFGSAVSPAPLEVGAGTTTVNGAFGAIAIDAAATLTINASATANGDVTVSGTLDTNNAFFILRGNTFTNSGTIINTPGSFGEIDFNGVGGVASTTQTIAGTGTYAPGASFPVEIHVQNTTTVTPAPGTILSGVRKFVTDSGTILLGNTLTFGNGTISGTITASGGGKLLTQGTATVLSGATSPAPLEVASGTTTASGTLGAIAIDALATLFQNGLVTASADVTINGTLDTNDQFLYFQGGTFTNSGTIRSNSGSFGEIDFKGVAAASGTTQHVAGAGAILSSPFPVVERIQNNTTVVLDTDFEFSNLTVDSGALNINGKTLSLSGDFFGSGVPITVTGTINTAGSTIQYDGTAAQIVQTSLNGANYNSLAINNAAGVTLSAPLAIPGTLTLANGSFITGVNLTMANNSTLARSLGTIASAPIAGGVYGVTYFGSAATTTGPELPAVGPVLSNLTINDAAGVTLSAPAQVNGTLALTSGNIATGSNTLIIAPAANVSRTSGHVIGNMQRTFPSAASLTFDVGTSNGYSPVAVSATAGAFPANFTVKATQGAHPSIPFPPGALARYWTLTGSGITATLTFSYLDPTDIPITAIESTFVLQKFNGSVFTQPGGSVNTGANTATISGVTSFSDWTLAGKSGPTVALSATGPIHRGQPSTVTATVTGPGGTPSGTVAVTGAGGNCNITLASGTGNCALQPTTVGANQLLTGNYGGDQFYVAASGTTQLTVKITLDIDDNGAVDALTDGLLALRYLTGQTGTGLTSGVIGTGAQQTDPSAIAAYLASVLPLLDIDGDVQVNPQTDGLLILRYLLGVRGTALIQGAVAPGAPRSAADIEAYILTLIQ